MALSWELNLPGTLLYSPIVSYCIVAVMDGIPVSFATPKSLAIKPGLVGVRLPMHVARLPD